MSGLVNIATCSSPAIQNFRGTLGTPISWEPPTISLPFTPGLTRYHVTGVACESEGGAVHVVSTETYGAEADQAYVAFARSLDSGGSWEPPIHLSDPTGVGPALAVGAEGAVTCSFMDIATSEMLVRSSTDRGATFGPAVRAAGVQDNLGTPPFGWHRRSNIEGELYYPAYRKSYFAPNFPALAVDRSIRPTRGNLYAVWAEYAEGNIATAASTQLSNSSNSSFETAKLVPLDCDVGGAMPEIHESNASRYIAFDGTAGQTVWIDGTASPFGGHPFSFVWELPSGTRTFSQVSFLGSSGLGPGRTAPIILSLPYSGRYYLRIDPPIGFSLDFVLRVRRYLPSPTSASRDMRDIVLVRSTDGGQTWSGKRRVNHDPPGVDQHQPNVAVDERGNVYVAWYDRRGIPGGDSACAYAAVSNDGGVTFGPDLKLSSRPSGWNGVEESQIHLLPGELIGDRIAIAAGNDYALVAWTDLRNWPARSDIYAARIVDVPTATLAVSDLRAEPGPTGIYLAWLVNDARAVAGVRVYRQTGDEAEVALGERDMSPTHAGRLEFLDTTVQSGHTYTYRLQVRGTTGIMWLGPVEVTMPDQISSLAWRSAWPNPFGRRTSIKLAVPRRAEGAVRVYDVQGKEVRTLSEGLFEPGERTLEWDGRDAAGNASAAGIYFISAQVGGESARLRVARVP